MPQNISRRTFGTFCASATSLATARAFAAPVEGERPTLRVVTYNIHHGEGTDGKFDYERQAKLIMDFAPDFVALQEVDRGTGRASGVDQAERFGKLTGLNYAFGRAMHYDGGEYGEALLSKYVLKEVQAHALPFRFGQEPRAALAARIDPGGSLPELLFVGTHLCHQSNETRTEQTKQLTGLFARKSELPVILAGDLNARPGSEPMQVLLENDWTDAIAPDSRIDYVLYRQNDPWRVVETKIVDDRIASDHRPVLAVLEWKG